MRGVQAMCVVVLVCVCQQGRALPVMDDAGFMILMEEVEDDRDRRSADPKHFGGLFGGHEGHSSSGSGAFASAGSQSSGLGDHGGSGSNSHASAQSQTYSFGPLSASFSQANAGSNSQSHSDFGDYF